MQKTQKKKREKHVFSSDELCHRFMHRLQESGKRPDGRMSFDGNTMYSYGWYAIGMHTKKKLNGKPVFLLTSDSYSPSTSKHISYLWSAIPEKDLSVVRIRRAGDIAYSIKYIFDKIEETKRKQSRFTKSPIRFVKESEIAAGIAELDTLKKLFPEKFSTEQKKALAKLRRDLMPERQIRKGLAEFEKSREELRKKREQLENERHAAELKIAQDAGFGSIREYRQHLYEIERQAEFAKWERGESSSCPLDFREDDKGFTRAIIAGDEFRTSLGIRIPVAVFLRLYNSFTTGKVKVGTFVLDFPVQEVTDTYIRIGCHTLGLKNLAELAATINS